jgi:hypothetical protein
MSSPSTTLQEARRLQLIAAGAIVGLAFFSATALLLPLVSEYSLTADYISELPLGRYGYLQTAAFFAAGGSSLALATGIREATKGSWGSRMGSAFLGLYGLGGVLVGIFPGDEVDAAGRVVSPTSVGLRHGSFQGYSDGFSRSHLINGKTVHMATRVVTQSGVVLRF